MSLEARLPMALRERLRANPFRKPNRYVEWNKRPLLAETTCKVCGVALTAMGADPRMPPMRRELKATHLRTVILETFVSRLPTAAYDTVEFEVSDPAPEFKPEGKETRDELPLQLGAHRTALCKTCKANVIDGHHDIQDVQWLYEADLERMAWEDDVNGTPEGDTLAVIERLANRRVTRVIG